MLNPGARKTLAAVVAVGALGIGAITVPQIALADFGTVSATTALNVRASPSTSARILGVLSSGEQVTRRGDPQGEWTPITYKGQDAWVYSEYVSLGSMNSAAGGTATATTAVNVRTGASTLTPVMGVLRTGESVSVTGSAVGGWVPVSYNGRSGYVYGAYLSTGTSTQAPPVATGSTAVGTAYATTAVNVRIGPSTSHQVLTVLRTGQSIEVRGSDQGGWTPVLWNGADAWISSQYITTNASSVNSGATQTSTGYTTTDVNLRTGPGLDYRVLRVLGTNTELALTGVTQNGFSQVQIDGNLRWVSTTYISSSRTTAPAQNLGLASTVTTNNASSTAQAALQIALAQVGKPYVWGATGPNSFDCSGLMVYAYKQVGVYLPRVTWSQLSYGTGVSLADAQPGDLIITNGGGHVGMYVGNGKMVNAGDESTGVYVTNVSYFQVVTVRRVA